MRRAVILTVGALVALVACEPHERAPTAERDAVNREAAFVATATPTEFRPFFHALDTLLTDAERDTLRLTPRDSLVGLHHLSYGMWIRNELGLWRGSPPADALRARGARHPDDMSGVLLEIYAEYLRGERVDLPAAIRRVPPPPTGFQVLRESGSPAP